MPSPLAAPFNQVRRRLSRRERAGPVLAGALALGAAAPPALPPDTLLLLVAPWCAPCWGELARIDALARAANPLRLRVLVTEDDRRARAMAAAVPPDRRWSPDERSGARAALAARSPGLPFAIATDARGGICAERGGALDPDGVRALVAACAPPR